MTRFVSLFRGINVGGHQQVKMDDLKGLHTSLGLRDVVTYIQSGNVVFSADDEDTAQLARHIENGFTQKFGFSTKVIVRNAAELQDIIANNPFPNQAITEPKWILVLFLSFRPDNMALEDLQKSYAGPEEYHLIGQELFIYYPDGIGRSKLTLPLIDKKLKTTGTGRNWNTVLQLQKMM